MESDALFLGVNEFKALVGADGLALEVLRNKKTGKLFMALNGENYRVEAAIDNNLPIKVLVPQVDGKPDYQNACLINVTGGAEEVFTL